MYCETNSTEIPVFVCVEEGLKKTPLILRTHWYCLNTNDQSKSLLSVKRRGDPRGRELGSWGGWEREREGGGLTGIGLVNMWGRIMVRQDLASSSVLRSSSSMKQAAAKDGSLGFFLPFVFSPTVGNLSAAATAAKTYILFKPLDPIMKENLKLYRNNPGTQGEDFFPRKVSHHYITPVCGNIARFVDRF